MSEPRVCGHDKTAHTHTSHETASIWVRMGKCQANDPPPRFSNERRQCQCPRFMEDR